MDIYNLELYCWWIKLKMVTAWSEVISSYKFWFLQVDILQAGINQHNFHYLHEYQKLQIWQNYSLDWDYLSIRSIAQPEKENVQNFIRSVYYIFGYSEDITSFTNKPNPKIIWNIIWFDCINIGVTNTKNLIFNFN